MLFNVARIVMRLDYLEELRPVITIKLAPAFAIEMAACKAILSGLTPVIITGVF